MAGFVWFLALAVRITSASVLLSGVALGTELVTLAGLDGAPGDEERVIEFIRERVGGQQRTGANGSLLASFGRGSPRILLVAGVDEPGFVVSGIHPQGYLWLQSLAETHFATGLGRYFRGQHVRVSTRAGRIVAGVVAAPSVHFASVVGTTGRRIDSDDLLVDIGASSSREVRAAGVEVLDRVTLEKRVAYFSDDWLAAPWVSSRVGAALLLALGRRLQQEPAEGTVTLAFVTQQYPYDAGLSRVLRSEVADRVLVIAPHGGLESAMAPVSGTDSGAVSDYLELASEAGFRLERKSTHAFAFGPFGIDRPWNSGQQITVLLPAVRNRATPAESLHLGELDRLARLLGLIVGLGEGDPDAGQLNQAVLLRESEEPQITGRYGGSFEETVKALVRIPGVSGHEHRVLDRIRQFIPAEAESGMRVDEIGNLIVRLGNADEVSAAFVAHMDEIGFEVQSVLAGGSVSATSKGGGSRELFAWQPSALHGAYGTLAAVMTASGKLELGGISGELVREMGVRAGDFATVPKRYRKLLGSRITARSLDDRLGCTVLVEVIRRLARRARGSNRSVEFVFSVEEETGLRGARHYAETSSPSLVYPIDTFVTSDSPFGPERLARASLGAGAVLRAIDESGMTSRREVERVAALARRNSIPLQYGVTAGGNDGSVFLSLGTANVPIGFPLRYAHTPVETADLRDAQAVVDLVELLALEQLRGR